jgi:hypothetical protein
LIKNDLANEHSPGDEFRKSVKGKQATNKIQRAWMHQLGNAVEQHENTDGTTQHQFSGCIIL